MDSPVKILLSSHLAWAFVFWYSNGTGKGLISMKNKANRAIVSALVLSVCLTGLAWCTDIFLLLFVTALPFFFLQLLLCRLTDNLTIRLLPALPVLLMLTAALYYLVFGSGWDRLASLIFALGSIAPTVGIVLGWLTGWLTHRKS